MRVSERPSSGWRCSSTRARRKRRGRAGARRPRPRRRPRSRRRRWSMRRWPRPSRKRRRSRSTKSPTCGCCSLWVDHMREAGFELDVLDMDDADLIRVKLDAGVPLRMQTCHTALVGDYVFEGHIPADVIAPVPRREAPRERASGARHADRLPGHGVPGPRRPLRRDSVRRRRQHVGLREPLTP